MSTRAHIELREGESKSYIYHHHDGYPSGVGMELKIALYNGGFFDTENKFGIDDTMNLICRISTQYEPDDGFHGDEEYYYIVDCDNRTLTCYKIPWDIEDFNDIFKDENTVDIKPD